MQDLFQNLDQFGRISELTATRVIYGLAMTLIEMRQVGIWNLDISMENVLIFEEDGKSKLKICDFGISAFAKGDQHHPKVTKLMGKVPYMAPEMLRMTSAVKAGPLQVFSLGVMMFMLVCGVHPFENSMDMAGRLICNEGKINDVIAKYRKDCKDIPMISETMGLMISGMLNNDPQQRASLELVVQLLQGFEHKYKV